MDDNRNSNTSKDPESQAEQTSAPTEKKPSKKKKLFAIIGIVAAVVVILAIVLFAVIGGNGKNGTDDNSDDGAENGSENNGDGSGTQAHTHTPADAVMEKVVTAGCLTKGSYDEVVYCSSCNKELSREAKTVDATGHTPADAVTENAVAAACLTSGSYDEVVYCSSCGYELSRDNKIIEAKGHSQGTPVFENEVEATCTKQGSRDEVAYCSGCGDEISRVNVNTDKAPHEYENGVCKNCPAKLYERVGDYVYFGEYPQSLKADDVTVTETQDYRGYYLGSDGFYYAAVVAAPFNSNNTAYKFLNGNRITTGETYYFKVEPIRWKIIHEENGEVLLHCDNVIDKHRFDDDSNNYANSEIRMWLNNDFFEKAFDAQQREFIMTTLVDNTGEISGISSNPYACEDTEDKIFLMSYAEMTNEFGYNYVPGSHWFSNDARVRPTSDYARARGAMMFSNESSSDYGNGVWWLRTPYFRDATACKVDNASIGDRNDYVDGEYMGVVPALRIVIQ